MAELENALRYVLADNKPPQTDLEYYAVPENYTGSSLASMARMLSHRTPSPRLSENGKRPSVVFIGCDDECSTSRQPSPSGEPRGPWDIRSVPSHTSVTGPHTPRTFPTITPRNYVLAAIRVSRQKLAFYCVHTFIGSFVVCVFPNLGPSQYKADVLSIEDFPL